MISVGSGTRESVGVWRGVISVGEVVGAVVRGENGAFPVQPVARITIHARRGRYTREICMNIPVHPHLYQYMRGKNPMLGVLLTSRGREERKRF